MTDDSFPRQQARTRRFTLGVPRAFSISPDGNRVLFLRTRGGEDPVTCLWEADAASGAERLVADPVALGADEDNLPAEERARRERVRETASGIVAYATDKAHALVVFALSGQVYAVDLTDPASGPRPVPARMPALDPRPDPTGARVAYVHAGALRVHDLATGADAAVTPAPENDNVTYGLAEFIAGEEMERTRGYWWSPDGTRLLVERADTTPVQRWHIADPANPGREPNVVAYPAAGTPNADVQLCTVAADPTASTAGTADLTASTDGAYRIVPAPATDADPVSPAAGRSGLTAVEWDRAAFPYLVTAAWGARMLVVVMSRDQKVMRVIDGDSGQVLREDADPHWVDVITGVPAQLAGGDIAWTAASGDTRGLVIAAAEDLAAAQPVTPPGLQVRRVLATDGDAVYFSASTEPTEAGVYRYSRADGLAEVATAPGLHRATAQAGTTVLVSSTLAASGSSATVFREGQPPAPVASHARQPNLPAPTPHFLEAGPAGIRTAVLFPSWHVPGSGKLPVLMDPYGGPHAQRVVKTASAFHTSQWLAEQGFAVVVADGRGTAGRGPAWDRAIAGDLATGVLADQVTALHATAAEFPDLDLARVAIRGWSFGGFLAALAALRRPDVFHAAIAGAPVTDWRLYDTCYTERYLGDPATAPEAYHHSSLTAEDIAAGAGTGDGKRAALLLIHGLADDNVVVAHTLRLSSLLLAAGYPHSVLPLSGVTHMTPQEVVAENMLLVQVAFLREALGTPPV